MRPEVAAIFRSGDIIFTIGFGPLSLAHRAADAGDRGIRFRSWQEGPALETRRGGIDLSFLTLTRNGCLVYYQAIRRACPAL